MPPLLLSFVIIFFAFFNALEAGHDQSMSPSGMYQQILTRRSSEPTSGLSNVKELSLSKLFEYAALQAENGRNVDNNCLRDMMIINDAANKYNLDWAKKFLDSNGAKAPGVMSGNYRWYGDFDQCRSIETVELEDDITISPQYCRLELTPYNYTTPHEGLFPDPKGLILGVCVSSSCQVEDLIPLVSMIPLVGDFKPFVNLGASHCLVDSPKFTDLTIVTIVIFSVIGIFMLIGLGIDLSSQLYTWLAHRKNVEAQIAEKSASSLPVKNSKSKKQPDEKNNFFVELLLIFSPYTNFLKLFAVQSSDTVGDVPNLNAINGIRTLSIFWVILGHTYSFLFPYMDNFTAAMGTFAKRRTMQFVFAGFYAVDTFFFLSGFLAYWSICKQIKPKPVWKFFTTLISIYFHRYIRLTIPFAALLLINLGLWAHLSIGPFYFQGTDYNCATNWWTNLVYVNNLVNTKYQCLGWAWYLGVDMQLFILTPFVVYLFIWKSALGWIASVAALCIQIICAFTLTYVYKMPQVIGAPVVAHEGDDRDYANFFEYMYIKPYIRLAPYAIGVMCAHLAIRHGRCLRRHIFSRLWLSGPAWLLMFGIMLALTYGQYGVYVGDYIPPRIADAFFNAVARIGWGIALGWLILACTFNHAGVIGRVLCWPVWAIPARLGYAAYLLHPMILNFYAQTSRRPYNATDVSMIFMYCSTIIISLLVSVPFTLAFESPVIGLQRLLIPSKSKKPTTN